MQEHEYRDMTRRTANYPNSESHTLGALIYCALGLGEAGEVQGKIKKLIRDNKLTSDSSVLEIPTDSLQGILDELGDLRWYIDRMEDELGGLPDSHIRHRNAEKLRDRVERGVIGGSGDHR